MIAHFQQSFSPFQSQALGNRNLDFNINGKEKLTAKSNEPTWILIYMELPQHKNQTYLQLQERYQIITRYSKTTKIHSHIITNYNWTKKIHSIDPASCNESIGCTHYNWTTKIHSLDPGFYNESKPTWK